MRSYNYIYVVVENLIIVSYDLACYMGNLLCMNMLIVSREYDLLYEKQCDYRDV